MPQNSFWAGYGYGKPTGGHMRGENPSFLAYKGLFMQVKGFLE
jgi:hypothetical protein